MATFTYLAFEVGARFVLSRVMSAYLTAASSLALAEESGLTIHEFIDRYQSLQEYGPALHGRARNIRLDKELGWDSPPLRHTAPNSTSIGDPFRILIVGDSVSRGFGPSGEDYISLLAERPYPRDVEIVNAAVDGFGIYQMTVKAKRELSSFPANVIVWAYIDNDLARPAVDYIWGMTRPHFAISSTGVDLSPPEELAVFLQRFDRAHKYFYVGSWILTHFWDNRRFYLSPFYGSQTRKLYSHVLSQLSALGEQNGLPVIVLRLPQGFDFRGRRTVVESFASALIEYRNSKALDNRDIEPCVRRILLESDIDFETQNNFLHPPAPIHAAYADCIYQEVLLPLML